MQKELRPDNRSSTNEGAPASRHRQKGFERMKANLVVFIAALLISISSGFASRGLKHRGVYLTVSSYEGLGKKHGHLEINWYGLDDVQNNDTFAALLQCPPGLRDWNNEHLYPVKQSVGRVLTSVPFPNSSLEHLMTGDCLGYWAVLLRFKAPGRNAYVIESACLRGRPRWMRDYCGHFPTLTLCDLFVPATHNSAMYALRPEWPAGDFIFTQDQTISKQLAFGIRSLDLRVGFVDRTFWIFHDYFKAEVTVESVLKQVRSFVQTTGEIVLLDFHRFTLGFDHRFDPIDERHRMLVELIAKSLGDVMAPRALFNNTIGDILGSCDSSSPARNQTVFVMYNYDYRGLHSEFLSPGVAQFWADAQDLNHLVQYLDKSACKKVPGALTSAQAELTFKFPVQVRVLRELAQLVNFNVTNTFRERYWKCTNVVATDYFLGNGIVELAIQANKAKVMRKARAY